MSTRKKAEALMHHYGFIGKKFRHGAIDLMYFGSSITILEFWIGTEPYTLEIGYCDLFHKEGELALILYNSKKQRIYSIAFSFLQENNEDYLFVGGIQGPAVVTLFSQETIKMITKDMHGLRPRNFMIFVLRTIARSLNLNKIVIVSTQTHIGNCRRVRFKKHKNFRADYNTYFEEEGGVHKGKFIVLPVDERRKGVDAIESKKRSLYKKRYQMMDDISMSINENLKLMMN